MKAVKDNTKMRGGQNYHAPLTFGSPKAHTKLYLSAQRLRAKAYLPAACSCGPEGLEEAGAGPDDQLPY